MPPFSHHSRPRLPGLVRAGLLVVAVGAILAMLSPRLAELLLFLPSRSDPGPAPVLAGIPGEDVTLETGDGTEIHAWWFEAGPGAPAVLFLHGNAGHIGHRAFQAEGMLREGISTLLLSYRGYGRSEGRPTEGGVVMDAAAGFRWVAERAGGAERVVVHGRSLGGAVAGGLLRTGVEPAGVILESTFTDLASMARAVYPFLPSFLLFRIRNRFDTVSALDGIRIPILLIHGTDDEIVPARMGRALHAAAPEGTRFVEVPGAGHNDLPFVAGPGYFGDVAAFVREVVR